MTTLAKLALRLKGRRGSGRRNFPGLVFMTDRTRLPDPGPIVEGLPRGSAVVLRDYDAADRRVLAGALARLCRKRGIVLLVAGDARLARAVGAGGLHLPEALARLGPKPWRLWRRPDWIVTAAVHGPAALGRARRAGADAALLSPVFPTRSHPAARPLGALRFAAWTKRSPLPVYALGGVTAANAGRLLASRAVGIAGIGGFARGV